MRRRRIQLCSLMLVVRLLLNKIVANDVWKRIVNEMTVESHQGFKI